MILGMQTFTVGRSARQHTRRLRSLPTLRRSRASGFTVTMTRRLTPDPTVIPTRSGRATPRRACRARSFATVGRLGGEAFQPARERITDDAGGGKLHQLTTGEAGICHDGALKGNVAVVRARRPSGRLFELTIERCSGEIVSAYPLESRVFGPYAYGPRPWWQRSY